MKFEGNILMVNSYFRMIGGIERYMRDMTTLFKERSCRVAGFFNREELGTIDSTDPFDEIHISPRDVDPREALEKLKSQGYETVVIHKLMDCDVLDAVVSIFPTTIAIIHDHDYYCMRSHKYFPYKRINCHYPFNIIKCSLCSGMLSKSKGRFPFAFNNPLLYRRRLAILRKVSAIVVLSDFMKRNMTENGFQEKRVHKIYPKITPKKAIKTADNKQNASPLNLLFAGQIIRGKGLDILIEAMSLVKSDVKLRIVGCGNDDDFIKEMICDRQLDSKVEFKGFSDNMNAEYDWANVVIVPSRWQEPFGLVGVEAFARGIPVIGFATGGISEWLKNGENGILVPSGNRIEMAQAVDKLAVDQNLRRNMGEAGLKFVESQCGEEKFYRAFSDLFNGIDANGGCHV